MQYVNKPPFLGGPKVLVSPQSNLTTILSIKSDHWAYEDEWRLIVELTRTIGTGVTDNLGHPVNLVQVPNEAIVCVYNTERTPHEPVKLIGDRLADENNRYRVKNPRKLVMSSISYGYEEVSD